MSLERNRIIVERLGQANALLSTLLFDDYKYLDARSSRLLEDVCFDLDIIKNRETHRLHVSEELLLPRRELEKAGIA